MVGIPRIYPWGGYQKKDVFRYEKNKFSASGLTAVQSHHVLPNRIAECPLQIESKVVDIRMAGEGTRYAIIEVETVTVHAHESIVLDDTHIDTSTWSPLIYNFRHYFGLGEELGKLSEQRSDLTVQLNCGIHHNFLSGIASRCVPDT